MGSPSPYIKHIDPFPFQFLTLVVSLEAIFLTTFIMISQNRQGRIAERRNHLDLQINLLAEQENSKMLAMLDAIMEHLGIKDTDPDVRILEEATQPDRGSSNGAEWANNAHLAEWQAVSPRVAGRVHPGFIASLSEVWEEVTEAIQGLCQAHLPERLRGYAFGRSVPLCFAGHSRGGALAILAGLRSLTTLMLPVRVVTFGAPRVGDHDFAQAYN